VGAANETEGTFEGCLEARLRESVRRENTGT
jgi:hypothetical protein